MFLGSCRKPKEGCEGTKDVYKIVPLSKSLRDKVPHTGRDTLVFFNQYGDTVYLRGIGSKDYSYKKTAKASYGADCIGNVHYSIDFKEIQYLQDSALSNTNFQFPINSIVLNADSTDEYFEITGRSGGVSITTDQAVFEALYPLFSDQYYTKSITINNQLYKCAAFGVSYRRTNVLTSALYFNHYQGIVQFIENDTVMWNRKLN